ncbi:hypothetical protein RB593_009178 [Gaeumannomyces tritici]
MSGVHPTDVLGGRAQIHTILPLAQLKSIKWESSLARSTYTRWLPGPATFAGGVPCRVPPRSMMECGIARSAVMGSMNVHMEISFEDGVKWIARLRKLNATSPPPALRDYILGSEVATLKFLEQTTVPAPKVFDFALKHTDNPVGVGYVLVEKLSGRSLRWSLATPEQRKKVMDQLADMFIKLQKHPFDRLCSLASMEDPRNPGPFARTSLTDFVRSEMCPLGPFETLEEYHRSSIKLVLDLIVREEVYSNRTVEPI